MAARIVGRRVRLTDAGHVGTVTRVTAAGMTVVVPGLTVEDVTLLED